MVVLLLSIGLALFISGMCSLAESVLLSLTPGDLAELSKSHPKAGETWTNFKKNIETPVAAILILNTTAHTIGASVAGASFAELFGNKSVWIFSIGFTFLMLQYTEILPKTVGVRFNRRIALFLGKPLFYTARFLTPIIWLTHIFNRPFEPGGKINQRSTVDEIKLMAALARQHHLIGAQQEQIILGATKISKMRAEEVMLPFEEVTILSNNMSMHDAIEVAHVDAHTRFPVCSGEERNNIIGYVNFKEIISHQRLNPKAQTFREIIRPITFVDPNTSASEALRMFLIRHEHIAVVRNVDKTCVGLITLEDVVEELVGEIEDEFDRLPRYVHAISDTVLLMGGGCPMKNVVDALKENLAVVLKDQNGVPLQFPADIRNASGVFRSKQLLQEPKSLAAWLEERSETPLTRGDMIAYGGLAFTIRRMRRQRVFDVQIQKLS